MALWIKAGAAGESVMPANGKTFTLDELQRYAGGLIEALELNGGTVMYLNEEGKLNDLPCNVEADRIAHRETGIAWHDGIAGDVLIATRAGTGGDEEEDIDNGKIRLA